MQRVALSGLGASANAMMFPVRDGWERFVRMKRAIDESTRGEAWDYFTKIELDHGKGSKGVFWYLRLNTGLMTIEKPRSMMTQKIDNLDQEKKKITKKRIHETLFVIRFEKHI